MTSLSGQDANSSFGSLLQTGNNGTGITGTLQTIQDGKGNNTALSLSSTQVGIGGNTIAVSGTSTINGSVVGNITGGGTFASGGHTLTLTGDTTLSGSPTFQVNVQRVTSTGAFTYTPTANMVYVIVKAQASGGNGGNLPATSSNNAAAGAGGSGSYAEFLLTAAQVGSSITGTLGAIGSNTTISTTAAWTIPCGSTGSASTAGTGSKVAAGGNGGGAVTTGTGTLIKTLQGRLGGSAYTDGSTVSMASGITGSAVAPGGGTIIVTASNSTAIDNSNPGYGCGGPGISVFSGSSGGFQPSGATGILIFEEYIFVP